MSKATTRSSRRRSTRRTAQREFSVGDVVEIATMPFGRTVQLLHKIRNGTWLVAHDEENSPDEEMSEENFVRVVIASPGGRAGAPDERSSDVVSSGKGPAAATAIEEGGAPGNFARVSNSKEGCFASIAEKAPMEKTNGAGGTVDGTRSSASRSSGTSSQRKASSSLAKTQNTNNESNERQSRLHRGYSTDATIKADDDQTVQTNNQRRSTRSANKAARKTINSSAIQSETSTITETTATSTSTSSAATEPKDEIENRSTSKPSSRSTLQRNEQGQYLKKKSPTKRSNVKVKAKPKSKSKAKAKAKHHCNKKKNNKTNHGIKGSVQPNETVIRVPMNTGTLVLYRGLYPRAEFIRRR
mmetsp:Transcript_31809/g.65802  ORF Transcript_31809/g.65802 Transcript_31809/m.65802 type:complete len:357 (+) Transcript_31809:242-1312(+)